MTDERFRLPLLLAVVAIAAAALTACGAEKPAAPPAPGSPERPLVAEVSASPAAGVVREPSASAGRAPGRSSRHDERSSGASARQGEPSASTAPQSTGRPGYQQLLKTQTSRPKHRFSPCNLVTASEARAILRVPIREPVEALQGPTCVYRAQTGKTFITLAVQTANFGKLKPQLQKRQRVAVSGHAAVCGFYGQPMLYVPLTRGRVLSISAPCTTAKNFALRALPHL